VKIQSVLFHKETSTRPLLQVVQEQLSIYFEYAFFLGVSGKNCPTVKGLKKKQLVHLCVCHCVSEGACHFYGRGKDTTSKGRLLGTNNEQQHPES